MSDLDDCSCGHLILEYASPGGRLKRISVLILLPDAVRISDIKHQLERDLYPVESAEHLSSISRRPR